VGLAQQEHRARYFRNSAIPGMSIETIKMTDEAREQMTNSISEKFSSEGAFKVFAPPPGAKVQMLGLTNKDSQLIEASNATRTDICGAYRVPPHKIGDLSRGTFSNIEQQNIEFATDCMRPRIVRFERRLDRDIVNALRAYESSPGDYFLTFNMDALYRGDMKSRYEAYAQAISAGWLVPNEARASEGRNPIKGLDEPRIAVNMETVSQAQARHDATNAATAATSDEADEEETANGPGSGGAEIPEDDNPDDEKQQARARGKEKLRAARLRAIAIASADRIVRREVTNLRKIAVKAETDLDRFKTDVFDFYHDLVPVVAEALAVPAAIAEDYCYGQVQVIRNADPAFLNLAIDRLEERSSAHLADLAMEARCVTA